MKKTELDIQGMHCASCATMINKGLTKVQGVKYANVNYASAKATIEYDEKKANESDLIEAVKKRGYSASIIEDLSKRNPNEKQKKETIRLRKQLIISLIFAVPAFIIGMIFMWFNVMLPYDKYILWALATPIQFYIGLEFYRGTWSALKNKTANMDSLIAIGTSAAYFYSVYLVVFNGGSAQYFETSAIIITLVILGKYFESLAKGKTSEAISKLMNLSPQTATVIRKGKQEKILADQVKLNEKIIVKPGEKIPVDGTILEGQSAIDESMITGESIPAEKIKGSKVYAGTINKHGSFIFKAEKIGKDTALSQIIKLVEEAQGRKAPIQRFADTVSAYFVPIVILIAIVTFISWRFIFGQETGFAIMTAVSVLVIACPCALGLATPTAIMVGTGKGASSGILIKGGDALETAEKIKYVIFDKTGTITKGNPEVTDFIIANKESEKEIISVAYSMEKSSEHPLAEAIVGFAEKNEAKQYKTTGFKAIPGHGVEASIKGKKYYLGNRKLMLEQKINLKNYENKIIKLEDQGKTVMILSDQKKILSIIAVADIIREEAPEAVRRLNKSGIQVYMITGDNERTAKAIAKQAGIKNVFADVLPNEKAECVKKLQANGKVAMIGDGINDAPALAQADIGIAMGSGTDVAMETGNVVLMRNNVVDVPKAFKLSKKTMNKVRQNMFWALIYNVLGIPIAAGVLYTSTGWLLSPILAGGAMALSSVSVLSNSLLLKHQKL